jgi:hypothetical protein
MTAEQHRDIERLAYLIWEKVGRPHGFAVDHWLEAEYLVLTGSWSDPDEGRPRPGGMR